jgi:hypothetical protein
VRRLRLAADRASATFRESERALRAKRAAVGQPPSDSHEAPALAARPFVTHVVTGFADRTILGPRNGVREPLTDKAALRRPGLALIAAAAQHAAGLVSGIYTPERAALRTRLLESDEFSVALAAKGTVGDPRVNGPVRSALRTPRGVKDLLVARHAVGAARSAFAHPGGHGGAPSAAEAANARRELAPITSHADPSSDVAEHATGELLPMAEDAALRTLVGGHGEVGKPSRFTPTHSIPHQPSPAR